MAAIASAVPAGRLNDPVPNRLRFWLVVGGVLLVAAPLGAMLRLLGLPAEPPNPELSFAHLVVVLNVAVLAALVAALLAAAAIQEQAWRMLLQALGYVSLAGFFAIHALATPGVILPASDDLAGAYYASSYHEAHGADAVLGISAYLSVLLPAILFAARQLPAPVSRAEVARAGRWLAGGIGVLLAAYGTLGLTAPEVVAGFPLLDDPFAYLTAGVSIVLLLFAAWQQVREFLASRLPTQLAQAAALVLLADAQVAMTSSAVWSPAWWEYHVLMLLAVLSALWALFVELDRRRGFERFVSPAVIDRVMAGGEIRLGGDRRVVTILFADLRGSTALAEQLTAEQVVETLNTCVGGLAECVFEAGGILDKFLGDGLMAIFGALPDDSFGAAAACGAVQAMRKRMAAINAERLQVGQPEIRFGTGIHTGEVVLGAVGLPRRSDYTAIGDTVNTASRLESLCKDYQVDCVLSSAAAAFVPGQSLERLGTAPIRGKQEALEVFTLARV